MIFSIFWVVESLFKCRIFLNKWGTGIVIRGVKVCRCLFEVFRCSYNTVWLTTSDLLIIESINLSKSHVLVQKRLDINAWFYCITVMTVKFSAWGSCVEIHVLLKAVLAKTVLLRCSGVCSSIGYSEFRWKS